MTTQQALAIVSTACDTPSVSSHVHLDADGFDAALDLVDRLGIHYTAKVLDAGAGPFLVIDIDTQDGNVHLLGPAGHPQPIERLGVVASPIDEDDTVTLTDAGRAALKVA